MSSINMPSDERTRDALAAVAAARDDYRSALVGTADQLRGLLLAQSGGPDAGLDRAAAELGNFAAGHIDVERFASLVASEQVLDEASRGQLERAVETLESLAAAGDEVFVAQVPAGGDLSETISSALAEAGRAYGAARTAELARTGRFKADEHGGWIDGLPPAQWSRNEREIAPPLVVSLRGEDFRAGGLTDFLDGAQKIVLLVEGMSPPAALVRCLTPGVHVLQTDDPAALARIGDTDGPAIAALVPPDAARFEHRPESDGSSRLQLVVEMVPEDDPKRPLGRISAFQQAEELSLLRLLTGGTRSGPVAGDGTAGADAAPATDADVLAAWILGQGGQGAA
jgi:hypothetical protein